MTNIEYRDFKDSLSRGEDNVLLLYKNKTYQLNANRDYEMFSIRLYDLDNNILIKELKSSSDKNAETMDEFVLLNLFDGNKIDDIYEDVDWIN